MLGYWYFADVACQLPERRELPRVCIGGVSAIQWGVMVRKPFNPDLVEGPSAGRPAKAERLLTVSGVTALVKNAIEAGLPSTLHIVGEISNFKRHTSGHLYLTLKDRSSELSCVMWRSAAASLKFAPEDGLEVVATGRVEVFERAGRYQLYIRKLEPRGVGSLELAFRQLCEKLAGEGLFEDDHKKALPPFPQRIVLVTSPTGAAVADMLRTIARRYPCVGVYLYPVRVQGRGAAEEIASAVRHVNAKGSSLGGVDLMIVGRGGGSLEDLWAFNEEIVARAIYSSRIPVISAVGHEVDVTVADLVADVRAATPTAAAELAVPVRDDLLIELAESGNRLSRAVRSRVDVVTERLAGVLGRTLFRDPLLLVQRREQLLDELGNRMHRAQGSRLHALWRVLDAHESVVQRIAPQAMMLRRLTQLRDAEQRLHWAMPRRLAVAERSVNGIMARLERFDPSHHARAMCDRVDRLATALTTTVRHRLAFEAEQLRGREQKLTAMSHQRVLARGFSITRAKRGRKVLRSPDLLKDHQIVVTQLAEGEFESRVVNLNQRELFE